MVDEKRSQLDEDGKRKEEEEEGGRQQQQQQEQQQAEEEVEEEQQQEEEEEKERRRHVGVVDEEVRSIGAACGGMREESCRSQGEEISGVPAEAVVLVDQNESPKGAQEASPSAAAAALHETATGVCGSSRRRPGDGFCAVAAVDEGGDARHVTARVEHSDKGAVITTAGADAAKEEEFGKQEKEQEQELENNGDEEEEEKQQQEKETGSSSSSDAPPHSSADGPSGHHHNPKDNKRRRAREYLARLHRESPSAEDAAADEEGEPYFGLSLGSAGAPKSCRLRTLSSPLSGGDTALVDDAAAPAAWMRKRQRSLPGGSGSMGKGGEDDLRHLPAGDRRASVLQEEEGKEEPISGGGVGSPGDQQQSPDAGAYSDPFGEDAISLLMTQVPITRATAAAAARIPTAPWCLLSSTRASTPAAAEGDDDEGGERHGEPASLPRSQTLSPVDMDGSSAAEKKARGGEAGKTSPVGLQGSNASKHNQDILCEEHKEGAEKGEMDFKDASRGHQAHQCWNHANVPACNEAPAASQSFNSTPAPDHDARAPAAPTPAVLIPCSSYSVAGSQASPEAASRSLGAQLCPPIHASQQQETYPFFVTSAGAAKALPAPQPSVTTGSFSEGEAAADGSEALQLSQRPQHYSRGQEPQEVNLDSPSIRVTPRSSICPRPAASGVVPMPPVKRQRLLPTPKAHEKAAEGHSQQQQQQQQLLLMPAPLWSSCSTPHPLRMYTHAEEEKREEEDGGQQQELKGEQEPSQIASTPPVPSSWPDPWEDFGGIDKAGEGGCRAGWEAAGSLAPSPLQHHPYLGGCSHGGGGGETEQLGGIVWRGDDTALMGPPSPKLVTPAMEPIPMPGLDSAQSSLLICTGQQQQQQQQPHSYLRGHHRDAAKGVRALSRTAGLRRTVKPWMALSSSSSPLSSAPSPSSASNQKLQGSDQNPLGPTTQSLMLELQNQIIPKLLAAAAAPYHKDGSSRGRASDVAERTSLLLPSLGFLADLPDERGRRDSFDHFWPVEDEMKLPTMMEKRQPPLAIGPVGFPSTVEDFRNGAIVGDGRSSCSSLPCHRISSSISAADFSFPPCHSSVTRADPRSSTGPLDAATAQAADALPQPSSVSAAPRNISIDNPGEARGHLHQAEVACQDDDCLEDPAEMRRRAQRGFSGLRFSAERLRQVRSMLL